MTNLSPMYFYYLSLYGCALAENESKNCYFAFRWIVCQFKREFMKEKDDEYHDCLTVCIYNILFIEHLRLRCFVCGVGVGNDLVVRISAQRDGCSPFGERVDTGDAACRHKSAA